MHHHSSCVGKFNLLLSKFHSSRSFIPEVAMWLQKVCVYLSLDDTFYLPQNICLLRSAKCLCRMPMKFLINFIFPLTNGLIPLFLVHGVRHKRRMCIWINTDFVYLSLQKLEIVGGSMHPYPKFRSLKCVIVQIHVSFLEDWCFIALSVYHIVQRICTCMIVQLFRYMYCMSKEI